MSVEVLMQELAALSVPDRRRVMAYLITLQTGSDSGEKRRAAAKIDEKDSRKFASLEDLDRRLGLAEDPPAQ